MLKEESHHLCSRYSICLILTILSSCCILLLSFMFLFSAGSHRTTNQCVNILLLQVIFIIYEKIFCNHFPLSFSSFNISFSSFNVLVSLLKCSCNYHLIFTLFDLVNFFSLMICIFRSMQTSMYGSMGKISGLYSTDSKSQGRRLRGLVF